MHNWTSSQSLKDWGIPHEKSSQKNHFFLKNKVYLSFGSQPHVGFLWSEWPSVSRKELKRSMSVLKDHNGHSEDERCDFPREFSKAGVWQYIGLNDTRSLWEGSWCVTRPEGWWLSKKCNFAHQSLLLAVAINRSWNCTQKMNLSDNIILGNGNKGKVWANHLV